MESFGVFCDICAGFPALLPIEAISVSRIPHPSARFYVGQNIKCIVSGRDEKGRITLSHKELLGTWEENASLFRIGETVPGIIRSVENYGIFVELTPNLAGLAEYSPDIKEGMSAAVYIKNIIPERKKIKLIIVDSYEEKKTVQDINYFFKGDHYEM
jgi:small subunit ribosomal protein S1